VVGNYLNSLFYVGNCGYIPLTDSWTCYMARHKALNENRCKVQSVFVNNIYETENQYLSLLHISTFTLIQIYVGAVMDSQLSSLFYVGNCGYSPLTDSWTYYMVRRKENRLTGIDVHQNHHIKPV
jgi:hypothetical protein